MENELEQANEAVEETEVEEETEEIVDESTSDEESQEVETPKTFTQDEVNSMVEKRLNRERKRMEREFNDSISKYQELAYLTQEGLKANNLEETLDKSREFYGKQGIKYIPNNADDEIVGKYYANEIISESDSLEDLQDQANKLSRKQVLSSRDEIVLKSINEEIQNRKRIAELKTIGVAEEEYNSNEFKEFEKHFTKDTPIKEVYNLYRLKTTPEKVVENPGSMKTVAGKEKKGYITEAEYDRMTDKEIEENMDLIRKSMEKW